MLGRLVRTDGGGVPAEMLDRFPDARLAVLLPATRHTEVMHRSEQLPAIVEPFLR